MISPESMILLFGISGGEIIVVLLLVLLLFGPKRIPEIARYIGKGLNQVKKVQRELNDEINRYTDQNDEVSAKIQKDIEEYKKQREKHKQNNTFDGEDNKCQTNNTIQDSDDEDDDDSDLPYPYNKSGKIQ